MALKRDDIFGGCRILTACGEGASGIVYLAENALGECVALKVLHSREAGEKELRGIRNYMRIHQATPSLITIRHAGIDQDRFFYIMDVADNASPSPDTYIPDTLAHRLQVRQNLPLQEALDICLTLLDGLSVMHEAGILHRDIKPENIFFIHGKPVLGDPGLAGSYSRTLSISGTLGYLPPELFHASAKPSPNTDIYALGKVLYTSVTGKKPGDFPTMPTEMDEDSLARCCRLVSRLCNADPNHRCQNCADCRQLLLEAARKSSRTSRLWWRLHMDRSFRRRFAGLLLGMAALLILAVALGGHIRSRHRQALRIQAEKSAALQRECQTRLEALAEQGAPLSLQFDAMGCSNVMTPWLDKAETAFKAGQWQEVLSLVNDAEAELEALAIKHLPSPAPDEASLQERLQGNARILAYLSSPLGKGHLPTQLFSETKRQAEDEAQILAKKAGTPKVVNGRDFTFSQGVDLSLRFVPPGRFRSPLTGQIEEIERPFWMLESEVTFRIMDQFTSTLGKRHALLEEPASQIAWNDFLSLCHDLTQYIRKQIDFPEGYLFRPPTEAEWEYAAMGGPAYQVPPSDPQEEKSPHSPELPGSENALHLKDMDCNLAELVLPYPGHLRKGAWTVARGACFKDKKRSVSTRKEVRLDQQTRKDIGFRLVLAPADKHFYEKAWHFPKSFASASVNGKYYVGMESCHAVLHWEVAEALARALGGRLPEPQSKEELSAIYNALHADRRFPAFLGIIFRDGKWRHCSNGREAPMAATLPPPPAGSRKKHLGATPNNTLLTIAPDFTMPEWIVEFPSEKAFSHRTRLPLEQTFTIDGRRFGLLKCSATAQMHSAIVELAGYRTPVMGDRQMLEKVLAQLKPVKGAVSLCCHRFYNEWHWSDSTRLPVESLLEWNGTHAPLASYGYSVAVSVEGHLRASELSDYILVEL